MARQVLLVFTLACLFALARCQPCTEDGDCATTQFCRQQQGECADYQQLEESCGGLTAFEVRCAAGLECDLPAEAAFDYPGWCRVPCTTNADCCEGQYCGESWGGVFNFCRDGGKCGTDNDCFDEDNQYASVDCVGPTTCTLGQCEKTCSVSCSSDDDCGTDQFCRTQTSECVDYQQLNEDCGGFRMYEVRCAQGLQCDLPAESAFDVPGACHVPCTSNDECGEEEYCGTSWNGEYNFCRPFGTCGTEADCYDEDNQFGSIDCVGTTTCSYFQCSKTCAVACTAQTDCSEGQFCSSSGFCKDFTLLGGSCGGEVITESQCAPGLECDLLAEAAFDYPGTCNQPCQTNDDCSEEQFCGEGYGRDIRFCREFGTCGTTQDCFDEDNQYVSIQCVGPTTCSFGVCEKTCSGNTCRVRS